MAQAIIRPPGGNLTPSDLQGSAAKRRKERVIRGAFNAAAWLSVIVTALIIFSLAREAVSFLRGIDLAQLFQIGWFPRRGMFDIRTLIAGTVLITGIAMLVAVPLGLGAAVYLSEYAKPRTRRTVKPMLEILAGIPSVVLGYFALSFITPTIAPERASPWAS
jgi:phosphate transport system permease protein